MRLSGLEIGRPEYSSAGSRITAGSPPSAAISRGLRILGPPALGLLFRAFVTGRPLQPHYPDRGARSGGDRRAGGVRDAVHGHQHFLRAAGERPQLSPRGALAARQCRARLLDELRVGDITDLTVCLSPAGNGAECPHGLPRGAPRQSSPGIGEDWLVWDVLLLDGELCGGTGIL